MAIPKFEDDLRIISKLGDNPGTDNGYTTQEFKEAFDKAPLLIQKFINEVLIPAANASSSPEEGLSMKGPINMNGQAIKGLNEPTADDEAVNWGSVKNAAGVGIPLPLGLEYGGVGATDPKTARENLEVAQAIESTEHPGCYYRMVDGEKEWLNPPCLFGVDYRTADRNNGNPVYTKVINLGVLSADKDVDPNLPAADYKVFDLTVYVDGRIAPTGWGDSNWDFTAYFSDNIIKIKSGSSFYGVKYNGYAQIWFCKGID